MGTAAEGRLGVGEIEIGPGPAEAKLVETAGAGGVTITTIGASRGVSVPESLSRTPAGPPEAGFWS